MVFILFFSTIFLVLFLYLSSFFFFYKHDLANVMFLPGLRPISDREDTTKKGKYLHIQIDSQFILKHFLEIVEDVWSSSEVIAGTGGM